MKKPIEDSLNIFDGLKEFGVEQYQERFLLFLDILGFKRLVEDIDKKEDQDINFKKIIVAYNKISEMHKDFLSLFWGYKEELDIQLAYVSDSIIISCLPFKDQNDQEWGAVFVIVAAFLYSRSLLDSQILVRGAIVENRLFHKKNIVFGKALNDAYTLEKDVAIYPRIIVEQSIADLWNKNYHYNSWDKDILVNDDDDGWNRINLFKNRDYGIYILNELTITTWLNTALSILKEEKTSREKELAKINWLLRKLNKGTI